MKQRDWDSIAGFALWLAAFSILCGAIYQSPPQNYGSAIFVITVLLASVFGFLAGMYLLRLVPLFIYLCGYKVQYQSEWGLQDCRYDTVDRMAGRPIHPQMGVAPPWAKRVYTRLEK